MAESNPAEIFIRHDLWAMTNLFDSCAGLTDAQLDREFEMGPGTLRKTLTHTLGAMKAWGNLLAGREFGERLEALPPQSIEQLRAHHAEIAADFADSVRGHDPTGVVSRERSGQMYHFTRGQVFTHVYTHSVHHRAQCLNMLRHLGVQDQPKISVVEWTFMEDPAG